MVTRFDPDHHGELEGPLDFDALTARLDAAGRPGRRERGRAHRRALASMRVRSVPRQKPPYPPLADVVAQQRVTDLTGCRGTVVGFRFPGPLDGIEIAGWHLHFVDAERERGGHVLGCVLEHGTAALDHEADLHVELPPGVDAPHARRRRADSLLRRLERDDRPYASAAASTFSSAGIELVARHQDRPLAGDVGLLAVLGHVHAERLVALAGPQREQRAHHAQQHVRGAERVGGRRHGGQRLVAEQLQVAVRQPSSTPFQAALAKTPMNRIPVKPAMPCAASTSSVSSTRVRGRQGSPRSWAGPRRRPAASPSRG